ncbi:NAD(P)-dependent oxidoreductase [Bacillus sp. FJAT-45350]|uniref:NAD(P)-dependent oxidoreductase n=1 Tax=Bacillus sp. FJAT-45350 TaxID=2011014 RepID=UPI000BB83448|nr:NAD(P)-dependent oxidoreductase [Bacillus sp. FJAT-45350]
MRIGFIGLGVMGARMVERFLQADYEVTVYNRTRKKMAPLIEKGARPAENIPKLVTNCDVVFTCLSMPKDVEQVYNTVIELAQADTVCVDFTTIDMDTSIRIASQASTKGIHYLDAPISGGPEGVEQGKLTIMVGGNQTAFERVLPILKTIGEKIHLLGDSGLGSVAKLMNQYLVAVHSLAASEVMVAGTAHGLPPEKLFDILKSSYGDSRMLRRHIGNHVLKRDFGLGGALKYMEKDIRIANQLFEIAGIKERTGSLAEKAFVTAIKQDLSELDMSAVIQPIEKQCNVIVKDSRLAEY